LNNLQKGDIIGIVSPAGFIKDGEDLTNAINLLNSWGLKVEIGKSVFNKYHHFAGTDAERIDDFQQFLDDDSIKAIWCARGGYGSVRIINELDFSKFKKNPKWIIGYSDITVFHHVMHSLELESLHAIMPTSIDSILNSKSAIESLQKVLFGVELDYKFSSNKHNKLGSAKAKIVGGNLSLIASMLGTKYALDTKDKILFIEEIGEYKYQIDRMFQSLKLNGYFEHCKGLILGGFTNVKVNDPLFGMSIEELILATVKEYNFPVCFDFPAGHIIDNNVLVFGREVNLEVSSDEVIVDFFV
jgi:muramoyltetrapeptide carboxypeptidase